MAIATYTDLLSAVANWSHRDDLTATIPDFITLVEADVRPVLRTQEQETKNAAYSITGEYVAAPADLLEVRAFEVAGQAGRYALRLAGDSDMTDSYPTGSGAPRFYSLVGTNFRFAPIPDGTYTATITYFAKFSGLTAQNTTNDLLTQHPNIYLFGVMYYAGAHILDAEMAQAYKALFEEAIGKLQRSVGRNRWGGPGLQIKAA